VAFTGDGTLAFSNATTFSGIISGMVANDANQMLDLGGGLGTNSAATDNITVAAAINGANTLLTVTDATQGTHESVTLAGTAAAGFNWSVDYDGNHGAVVFDPATGASGDLVITEGNPAPVTLVNDGQPIVIGDGVSAQLDAPSSQVIAFAGPTGSLILDQPGSFTGHIDNFTGTAPDPAHSDTIDLVGVDYNSSQFAETYNASTGLLTVSDGSNGASFTFDHFSAALDFASDGNGGTLITDPPAGASTSVEGAVSLADSAPDDTHSASVTPEGTNYIGDFALNQVGTSNGATTVSWEFDFNNEQVTLAPGQTATQSYNVTVADMQNPAANQSQAVSVTIGGPGNDNFVFAPGVGADTVVNFNPQHDTIELDHFASAQTVQELQSLITTDAHGDAMINLGHNDSVTLANTTMAQLQQVIQAGHVLLH
jgi:hypothetical protein